MRLLRILPLTALLLLTCAARADSFTFHFSGPTDTGSGTLTAAATGTPGEYLVTNITGTVNNLAITSLLPPGAYPPDAPNDNSFFYPADSVTTYFDDCGISFELSDGTNINLYYGTYSGVGINLGPGYILIEGVAETPSVLDTLTFTPAASSVTPEPSTLTLLATGLLGLAKFRNTLCKGNGKPPEINPNPLN